MHRLQTTSRLVLTRKEVIRKDACYFLKSGRIPGNAGYVGDVGKDLTRDLEYTRQFKLLNHRHLKLAYRGKGYSCLSC